MPPIPSTIVIRALFRAIRRPRQHGGHRRRSERFARGPRLGSARLGSARLVSARLGSARLGSARLGSARLGPARPGSARRGPTERRPPVASRPDPADWPSSSPTHGAACGARCPLRRRIVRLRGVGLVHSWCCPRGEVKCLNRLSFCCDHCGIVQCFSCFFCSLVGS